MIAPDPDVDAPSWYYDDMSELEDFPILEEGGDVATLHGEGESQQGPDDEIGRAWEDLEALTDSA